MGVNGAADEKVAADFAAGRIRQGLVDAQLVQAGAAFEMEVVQEVDDDVARRGDEVLVPRCAVAVDRRGAAAVRKEGRGEADILHVLEGRIGDVAAILLVAVIVGTVVEHGDAIADQLDMAELFGGDAGDQAVERPELGLAAKIEALEHVVVEGRHLAILAAQQFLEGSGGVRIRRLGRRQFGLQLVDA